MLLKVPGKQTMAPGQESVARFLKLQLAYTRPSYISTSDASLWESSYLLSSNSFKSFRETALIVHCSHEESQNILSVKRNASSFLPVLMKLLFRFQFHNDSLKVLFRNNGLLCIESIFCWYVDLQYWKHILRASPTLNGLLCICFVSDLSSGSLSRSVTLRSSFVSIKSMISNFILSIFIYISTSPIRRFIV